MRFKFGSKKGVTNIMMMLGIAIAIIIILVASYFLIATYLVNQATADSEYLTKDLVLLMNAVQTAPEGLSYAYYTGVDENGYPVIGSLEVDFDKAKICAHPHSEAEIYSVISEQTKAAAGFGATVYAISKMRQKVKEMSLKKAAKSTLMIKNSMSSSTYDMMLSEGSYAGTVKLPGGAAKAADRKAAGNLFFSRNSAGSAYRNGIKQGSLLLDGTEDSNRILTLSTEPGGSNKLRELESLAVANKNAEFYEKAGEICKPPCDVENFKTKILKTKNDPLSKIAKDGSSAEKVALAKGVTTKEGNTMTQAFKVEYETNPKFQKLTNVQQQVDLAEKPTFGQKIKGKIKSRTTSSGRAGRSVGKAGQSLTEEVQIKGVRGKLATKMPRTAKALSKITFKGTVTKGLMVYTIYSSLDDPKDLGFALSILALGQVEGYLRGKLYKVAPEIAEKPSYFKKFGTWLVKKLPKRAAAQAAVGVASGQVQQTQPADLAAGPPGWVAFLAKESVIVAINVAIAVIDMVQVDLVLLEARTAANAAIKKEKALFNCANYTDYTSETTGDAVMGWPPNCVPYLAYGLGTDNPGETREGVVSSGVGSELKEDTNELMSDSYQDLKSAYKKLKSRNLLGLGDIVKAIADFLVNLGELITDFLKNILHQVYEWVGSGMESLIVKISPHVDCYDNFEFHSTATNRLTGLLENTAVSAAGDPSSMSASTIRSFQNSGEFILGTGCDQEGLGQDCPNYYLSDKGDFMSGKYGLTFVGLLQLGPVCAAWSFPGTTQTFCNIARYMAAAGIFLLNPGDIYAYMMKTNEVGLQKEVKAQTINGDPCTGPEQICYSDNEGYYYMEFPGVIMLSKQYDPQSGQGRLIVSKG